MRNGGSSDEVEYTQIRWEGLQTVEGVRFPKALILNLSERENDGVRIEFQSVEFDVEIKGEPFALLREGESPLLNLILSAKKGNE